VACDREGQYEDVFARTTPVPHDWGMTETSLWSGTRHRGPVNGGPKAAEQELINWSLVPLLPYSLLVIVGWHVGPLLGSLIARFRRVPAPPRTRASLMGATATLILCAAASLALPSRTHYVLLGPTRASGSMSQARPSAFADTGWTVDDIRAALSRPGGIKDVATQLASVLPTPQSDRDVLVIAADPIPRREGQSVVAGWPAEWLFAWFDTSKPPIPHDRAGPQIYWRGWGIVYASGGTGGLTSVVLDLRWLLAYSLTVIVAWKVVRSAASLVSWLLIRRSRTLGRCMCCGYDLRGLAPAAPGSQDA
jgi:hypothetical protein